MWLITDPLPPLLALPLPISGSRHFRDRGYISPDRRGVGLWVSVRWHDRARSKLRRGVIPKGMLDHEIACPKRLARPASLLEWNRWFAWYPVPLGKLHYAWLQTVERKWGTSRY